MATSPSVFSAHRCSFDPGRQDSYIRLGTVTVFVRDQERSLRFFHDTLGFSVAFDQRLPSGDRWLAVTPPDGTAMLSLAAAKPGSEEFELIGKSTQITFLTENLAGKFEDWVKRGVRFRHPPQMQPWGAVCASFEDIDGNSFVLAGYDPATREIEVKRLAHVEMHESAERAAKELEIARQTQARLFPQTQPYVSSLDYAGVCLQAAHVGGDYYDFLDLGRDRLGLVIGDISGKGVAAALLMANLQAHLRNQCATYWARPYVPFALSQPLRLLKSVNRLFYENTDEGAYATFVFAEYDDAARRLRLANCGHLAALVLRNDNRLERLDSTGTVLGMFQEWVGGVRELELACGDVLALYTDGATESSSHHGEEFGEPRLVEALQRHREMPPAALCQAMVDEVQHFSHRAQHDDLTFIVAKCRQD